MRLTRLTIENFRGFEQLDLDLNQPVIVLVGINGSGKTTVLEAIGWCLWSRRPRSLDGRSGSVLVQFDTGFEGQPDYTRVTFPRSAFPPDRPSGPWVAVGYPVNRHASDATSLPERPGRPESQFAESVTFEAFFHWFKRIEDFENQERREEPTYRDGQLEAVRVAISTLLPDYSHPRVSRDRRGAALFSVDKRGSQLAFDAFSEGERTLIALVADIARRAALTGHDPPLEAPGVVLIDEIDLHLHPGWQREVLPRLTKTFPNIQFITTTHSPIVVSSVPSESIRALKDFKLVDTVKTQDRDPNSILEELFGVSPRPPRIQEELQAVADLIDQDNLVDAKTRLTALSATRRRRRRCPPPLELD